MAQMMPTHVYHEIGEWTCPMLLHLYWPSMIYENEDSEYEECAGNVLYTICEVDEQDGNFHDEPSGDDRACWTRPAPGRSVARWRSLALDHAL